MQIFQFRLAQQSQQVITMPRGARPLGVGQQVGDIHLWALVDPEAVYEDRNVYLVGTGAHYDPSGTQFVGTVIIDTFAWHVFVEVENTNVIRSSSDL